MLPQEVIFKKQHGSALAREELQGFFNAFLEGKVLDYQVSAFLMSCYFNGMSLDEITELTLLAKNSGRVFEWSGLDKNLIIDKHSTGGVGDKTSLILYPLCVLEGLKVPMVSGRSLGHTGGTIDKLESIPGICLDLNMDQAQQQLCSHGGFIMGQTDELAPLDRKLYAIRDVCSIVASIPLITASILSKKLAEGLSGLVLDVKFGSGAFLADRESALELAKTLEDVADQCGLNTVVSLNSMNSPLGQSAGNALEVLECCEVLKGEGPEDTRELSIDLATKMVKLAYPQRSDCEIRGSLTKNLENGRAFAKFCELIALQGGDVHYLENPEKMLDAPIVHPILAESDGFIKACDVRRLGLAIASLGGGRTRVEAKIDHAVGLTNIKHVGEQVSIGEPLAYIHARDSNSLQIVRKMVLDSFNIVPTHS